MVDPVLLQSLSTDMIKGSASMILTRSLWPDLTNSESEESRLAFNDKLPKRLQQTGDLSMCSSSIFYSYLTKVGRIKTYILHVKNKKMPTK